MCCGTGIGGLWHIWASIQVEQLPPLPSDEIIKDDRVFDGFDFIMSHSVNRRCVLKSIISLLLAQPVILIFHIWYVHYFQLTLDVLNANI